MVRQIACEQILERLKPYQMENPKGTWEDWVSWYHSVVTWVSCLPISYSVGWLISYPDTPTIDWCTPPSAAGCLSVFVRVCVSLPACLPGCRSCLTDSCLSVCLSVSRVCLSAACLPICLSVCLSFRFSVISSMNYLPFTKFAFVNHFILVLLINLISSYVKEP